MKAMEITHISDRPTYEEFMSFLSEPDVSVLSKEETKDSVIYLLNTEEKVSIKKTLIEEDKYSNDLIFGKDKTKNIVNVSVENDTVYIFQEINGKIVTTTRPAKFWIVSRDPIRNFKRLQGKSYYNFIYETNKREDFINTKKYLYGKEIWSIYDESEANMITEGLTYFKGMKVEEVSVLSFDLETTGRLLNKDSKVLIISNTLRKNGVITKKLFKYDDYDSDAEMIHEWAKWVREVNPSFMCGHNVLSYDFPYLSHCYKREYDTDVLLGRDDSSIQYNNYPSNKRKDGSQSYEFYNAKIFGRDIVDTFFLALTYDIGRKYVSYALKQIIKQENLEKSDRQHYDASQIYKNYKIKEEWNKILQYAKDDADDALALFDLMIPSFFYYAQSVPKTIQQIINSASGAQINSFLVRSYLSQGKGLPKASEVQGFEGAISMGIPGVYHNVCKADVSSMYPSIILQYQVYDKNKDPEMNYLKMVDYFTKERLKNKKLSKDTGDRYYKDVEQAMKIFINSSYGLMNAPGLLFNSPYQGAFITRKGREILTEAVLWATGCRLTKVKKESSEETEWSLVKEDVENKGFSLVNVDTDSFSFTRENKHITKEEFAKILEELNSISLEKIKWDDDGIYDAVLVIKSKNYVLKQGDKIKYKGSAIIDQKKEPALTEMLQKACQLLIDNKKESLVDLYNKYVKEAYTIQDIKRWAVKKTVTSAVLESDRANEEKVRVAIGDMPVQEGDKIWLYTAKPVLIPRIVKGEQKYYKDGRPMMREDSPLELVDKWQPGKEDKLHYVERVYNTFHILKNLFDIESLIKYHIKKNVELLDTDL